MKVRSVGDEFFHADGGTDRRTHGHTDRRTGGQADRHDEATSRFSQFCEHT